MRGIIFAAMLALATLCGQEASTTEQAQSTDVHASAIIGMAPCSMPVLQRGVGY
jgi:hypothetical protein